MKQYFSINQPFIRAKIIGIILIIIGSTFLLNPTSLNIKIGFASILIGILMIFMITPKSIPKEISDDQIEGNIDAVKRIIKELHLDGNAVFLSKSDVLNEERVLIPPNKSGIIKIPNIDNDQVFLTGPNRKNLGISIPPSGLKLLNELEKDENFENTEMENIEEKLQKFVGMNLLSSVSFKKRGDGWDLELDKPTFCPNDKNLCRQYPCPPCSAVITAITRAARLSNKKLWINNATHNGKKIKFHLNFINMKTKQGE